MHTTTQLLDALAEKHDGATDYRLGKLLNTSSQTVSNWRKGRTALSQDYALRVASLLDWDPAYVLACVERERAEKDARLEQTDEIRATWERIAAKFAPRAAGIVLALVAAGSGGFSTRAQAVSSTSAGANSPPMYIMVNYRCKT